MKKAFTTENTEGYTQTQLDNINAEWETIVTELGLEDYTEEYYYEFQKFSDELARRSGICVVYLGEHEEEWQIDTTQQIEAAQARMQELNIKEVKVYVGQGSDQYHNGRTLFSE